MLRAAAPRLLTARSNLTALAGRAGWGGRKEGEVRPRLAAATWGAVLPGAGRGGVGSPRRPCPTGFGFSARAERWEGVIHFGPGWGPDESDPFASDLTVSSLPGSLARSWSAPYAGHLFRFPTHSGPILPPPWEPCSGLLLWVL